jgi:hypothetical protein
VLEPTGIPVERSRPTTDFSAANTLRLLGYPQNLPFFFVVEMTTALCPSLHPVSSGSSVANENAPIFIAKAPVALLSKDGFASALVI